MPTDIQIGDRVQVLLKDEWFEGTVVRIDPYSAHRSFYWVEFDEDVRVILGFSRISVFNPRNIKKKG